MNTFRHSQAERLKSRKAIGILFKGASSTAVYPVRIVWHMHQVEKDLPQVGFSVPKRKFKKAVDRNRLKRLMFEAYRLQKQDLIDLLRQKEGKFQAMFLYTGDQIVPFEHVSACMEKLLRHLCVQIQEKIPT